MKLVTAVIKPHKWEDVRVALETVGVTGMTVSEVSGYGRQKGHTEVYRGAEYDIALVPKIRIEIVVDDADVGRGRGRHRQQPRRPAGSATARSGCRPVETVVRVRTGDRDEAATLRTHVTAPNDRQRAHRGGGRAVRAAYDGCGGPDTGAALVAVGGYGRAELAPYSDLDVVLVHDEGVDLGDGSAEQVWYPLWDSGAQLDHSVRTLPRDGGGRRRTTCGSRSGCSTSGTWPATPT